MKRLYIIFVNFNSGNQLKNGIKFVLKSPAVSGIIVVDNGSKDNSLELAQNVKNSSKKITVIKNRQNLGFYKALNIGIKKAISLNANLIMPLDFDLEFDFDFVSELLKVNGDIVAPALKYKMNGKWFYDYGGRINWKTGLSNHIIKSQQTKNPKAVISSTNHSRPDWIDFVSGGCTIINLKVVKKIGYFDEGYFVYWGDAEYSLRAREAGFKVIMDGKTLVHHKLEISRQTKNFKKLKISFYDNITFINKRIKWFYKPLAYLFVFLLTAKVLLIAFRSLIKLS